MGLIGMTAVVPMVTILPGWWLVNLLGPAFFILVGFLVLIWGVVRRSPPPSPVAE
jgi:hypothetical protein